MKKNFRFKILIKTILLAFVLAFIVVEVAMTFHTLSVSSQNRKNYENKALELSGTVAVTVDVDLLQNVKGQVKSIYDASETKVLSDDWGSPEWEAYMAQFDSVSASTEFKNLKDYLQRVMGANSEDISCIYFAYLDNTNEHFIYICDSAEGEDECRPGCIDPLYDENRELLTNPERGFPPYTTNTEEYGHLMTAGTAVKAGNEVIAYALIDISMDAMRANQAKGIVELFAYMSIATVIIGAIAVVFVGFVLVRPLRLITQAAAGYDHENPDNGHESFKNLNIKNHDEIGELAYYMKKMENDVNAKINELINVNAELNQSRSTVKEMATLANKDGLTSVRNKNSYNSAVANINKKIESKEKLEFAIVMIDLNDLKLINDSYGHTAGDIALIKLASIISGVFTNSPVFRVGGDEFVVILTKSDFARREVLYKEFNYKIEKISKDQELEPRERISAALGAAIYNMNTDKCVNDVFTRADQAMYEHKKKMKKQQ